jgi:hypothetical protein
METIENKMRWLAAAADGEWRCSFAHETKLAFARIARDPKTQFAVV